MKQKSVFSDRIKESRENSGLLQKDVAFAMEVSQATLAHWEAGRNEPSINDLTKLARILKTDIQFLLSSPSQNRTKVTYVLTEEVNLKAYADETVTAPRIQIEDDNEQYIVTIVGSNRYHPTYKEGDFIYARQRTITPALAVEDDLEVMVVDVDNNKYIGKLSASKGAGVYKVVISSQPPQTIKIKKVHPIIWVKRNI